MAVSKSAGRPDAAPGLPEYALLVGISVAWGTSYMFTKVAVGVLNPVFLAAARLTLAAVVMLIYVRLRGIPWPTPKEIATFAAVGLLSNGAPLTLIAVSVSYVNSSVTAIIMSLVPLITVWMGIFVGSRPDLRSIIGILLGLVGVLILFGPDAFASFGSSARGLLAGVGAATIFSLSLFLSRRVRHLHSAMVTAMSLTWAALWIVPLSIALGGLPDAIPAGNVIGSVVVLGLWNTAAASMMMFALLGRATPTFTSYNNQLVPGIAVICGTVFLGEPLTLVSATGVILVLVGVAISSFRPTAPKTVAPA